MAAAPAFLRRLLGPFQEFGLGAGALYATDRALSRISSRLRLYAYEFVAQPVPAEPLLPAHLARSYEFREIGRGHPDLALMPARAEIKESRFDQGAVCLGTYKKGKLVGYVWLNFGPYREDEVRCLYAAGDAQHSAFDFDIYLFPEHRMSLGFMAIWHGANEYLRDRGVAFTFSRMTRFNLGSRRAHARFGAETLGRALFLRAWRCELMLATLPPYVYVSLSERGGPKLTLRADRSPACR